MPLYIKSKFDIYPLNPSKEPDEPHECVLIDTKAPLIWGPALWFFLHIAAGVYHKESKEAFRNVILNLPETLPCEICGYHLKRYLENHKEELEKSLDSETLDEFFINLHNDVNRRYGKEELSVEEAKKLYIAAHVCECKHDSDAEESEESKSGSESESETETEPETTETDEVDVVLKRKISKYMSPWIFSFIMFVSGVVIGVLVYYAYYQTHHS